jgi:hypothetical protein
MRTVPFELAVVDVVWSTACKWMKLWGLIFSGDEGLISKSWRSTSYAILRTRDPKMQMPGKGKDKTTESS